MCGNGIALEATVTNSSPSPPPFMVGAAEVEVDLETGEAKVIDYAAAVDCRNTDKPEPRESSGRRRNPVRESAWR